MHDQGKLVLDRVGQATPCDLSSRLGFGGGILVVPSERFPQCDDNHRLKRMAFGD